MNGKNGDKSDRYGEHIKRLVTSKLSYILMIASKYFLFSKLFLDSQSYDFTALILNERDIDRNL